MKLACLILGLAASFCWYHILHTYIIGLDKAEQDFRDHHRELHIPGHSVREDFRTFLIMGWLMAILLTFFFIVTLTL